MKPRLRKISIVFGILSNFLLTNLWASRDLAVDQGRGETRALKETPINLNPQFGKAEEAPSAGMQNIQSKAKISFILKGINLEGRTAIPLAELEKFWEPSLNKEISLSDLQEIAQKISNYYRQKGFFLTQVLIPPQKIMPKASYVNFKVVEGILNSIRVEGGGKTEQDLINSQIKDIEVGGVLNMKNIETRLLSVRKTPGYDIRPILVPAKDNSGSTDLVLKIESRTLAQVAVSYDNSGNKLNGKHRVSVDSVAFNTVARSKTLASTLHDYKGAHYNFYRARQTQFIGNYGTRAYFEYVQSKARPDILIETKSKYDYANIMLMHPLIYKRDQTLRVRLAVDGQNDSTKSLGQRFKDDYIRAIRVGLLYNKTYENDFWEVSSIVHRGLRHGLGARKSNLPSRLGGRRDFLYADGRALWAHQFNERFSMFTMLGWQASRHPLLASEEMSIGQTNFGRGYESTEISGDMGFGALIEGRVMTRPFEKLFNFVQYYTSYGGGRVINYHQKVDSTRKNRLTSFALGVRASMLKNFTFNFEAAKPISKQNTTLGDKKWRFTAKVTFKVSFNRDFQAPTPLK